MPKAAIAKANGQEKLAQAGRVAAKARWEAVRENYEQFIEPFHSLPIEKALDYLADLHKITEAGGGIINDRVTSEKNMKCSGPRCGKNLEGLGSNGMPKYFYRHVMKDNRNPMGADRKEHFRIFYFCSELCWNGYVRDSQGAQGSEAKK